ncbi:UV-endonuclease UvdE-domain-containing protein [Amylocystis lapponica]|nr:UV-endonuclease UvdE-domain-containing protein [Amylocystis lapponica]
MPQPQKKRRRKKVAEPVVYDIAPVEQKTTTFKGRLGYACLNTILRAQKPEPVFCSRTCRLETIRKNDLQFAKDLGLQNCRDLLKIIEWNEVNKIRFFRLSSEMFPFASHGKHGYSLEYAAAELKAAGDLAKSYGHRLTTHPGQFTQLASPKEDVVTASVRELEYHCQMMHYMGLDKDSVIIIHMGGVYGDKPGTLDRFRDTFRTRLTDDMRARIVLENDEMCYNADELLPVCDELGIPLVFDYHHNWIYPSVKPLPELLPLISATWERRGIRQKQHLSSPRPGAETVMEKRAHADRCDALPDELPVDMDLMIEAKDKEQAVLHLYRMYNLEPVVHANLRPEKPPKPFVRSKARIAADAAAAADGEDPGLDADLGTVDARPAVEPDATEVAITVSTPIERKKHRGHGKMKARAAMQEESLDPVVGAAEDEDPEVLDAAVRGE